jgi:hypothetical protein
MDDDDVPLFTEETFRRYEARVAAAKATVQAATGMSDDDDDDDVSLFPGTHRPAASSFVSS